MIGQVRHRLPLHLYWRQGLKKTVLWEEHFITYFIVYCFMYSLLKNNYRIYLTEGFLNTWEWPVSKEFFFCRSILSEVRGMTGCFNAHHVSVPPMELFLLPQGPPSYKPPSTQLPLLPALPGYFKPHWSLHSELQWDFLCVSHYLVLQFIEQIFIFSVLGSKLCSKGDTNMKNLTVLLLKNLRPSRELSI